MNSLTPNYQKEREEVINLLLSYGLPPLPVAPRTSKIINGKCPSGVDKYGHNYAIAHSKYREVLPTQDELNNWFNNSNVGIGTLGLRDIVWIDIDRKNFATQEDCDKTYQQLLLINPELNNAYLEKTHSGGYRIGVRCENIPNFTNFRLSNTKHIGELIHSGGFTVLAPTMGNSGNYYENINRPVELPLIHSVESLGIFPVSENKVIPRDITPIKLDQKVYDSQGSVNLIDCITADNKAILEGSISESDDRSALFTKAIRDLFGWENWLKVNAVKYIGNAEKIAYESGVNIGFNNSRIDYIIKPIDINNCRPACYLKGGDNACQLRINKLLGIKLSNENKDSINDLNWQNWIKSKTFTASKQVLLDSFQFPDDIPLKNAVIAVKSGLGTGKTIGMLEKMKESSIGSILCGYRNTLLLQTIKRGEECFVKIHHINKDGIVSNSENISLSCCINSLFKLESLFEGRDIYIDETVSVLLHLIDGGTFNNYEQKRAMELLEKAVRLANRVFLLDGNLTDDCVNFIHSFDSSKELYTLENQKKIAPHNIVFCQGAVISESGEFEIKPTAKSHLINYLLRDECVPFIATDSKKFAHELNELMIKKGRKGIIISADTIQEMDVKEFLENPDIAIVVNAYEYVIVTPSCESGISIQLNDYFTDKFSFFCGVIGTSSQHQIMFRLRDNKPTHYVFCPDKSQIRDKSIPDGYTVRAIVEALLERITLSAFMAIDIADCDKSAEIVNDGINIAKLFKDKWFIFAAKIWGLKNFERDNMKKCLMWELKNAGHNVREELMKIDEKLDAEMKEIKEELVEKEADLLMESTTFETVEELEEMEREENISISLKRKIKKSNILLKRLPGLDKCASYGKDFWKKELEKGYLSKIQNYARLQNFNVYRKRHESNIYHHFTSEFSFIGNLRDGNFLKIAALHKLGILELIDPDREYHKNDQKLIDLFHEVNNDPEMLMQLGLKKMKLSVDKKEVIILIKKLFDIIGVTFNKSRQKLVDNKKIRVYTINMDVFNDELRCDILSIFMQKDNEWILSEKSRINWYGDEYEENKAILKKNLEIAIENNDYQSCVELVEDYEGTKIYNDELSSNEIYHNEKINNTIRMVLGSNASRIFKLQKEQSRNGDRELITSDGKIVVSDKKRYLIFS